MAEFLVTVNGDVEVRLTIEAQDEDDACNQAERLFEENVGFSPGDQLEDMSVSHVEAIEAENLGPFEEEAEEEEEDEE